MQGGRDSVGVWEEGAREGLFLVHFSDNLYYYYTYLIIFLTLKKQAQEIKISKNLSENQSKDFLPKMNNIFPFINIKSILSIINITKSINIMITPIIIILSISLSASQDPLVEFKLQMETKVMKLAQEMVAIYARRCDYDIITCNVKSINQCNEIDQKICYGDFPTPPSCLSEGAFLAQNSGTRFPNDVDIYTLTEQQRNFVCASATMEPSFHELNKDRNQRYGVAFIGTVFGSVRSYPASIRSEEQCADYDPRNRPWYAAATSGGKNIIIILDISDSMSGNKINYAKEAVKSVLNTLSNNDFVGVVTFSNDANSLLEDGIKRATLQFKEKLIQAVDSLEVYGGTNYEVAFQKAFAMLGAAERDQFGSPCLNAQNVILFLTDGYPGQGATSLQGLIGILQELDKYDISIFTYGIGSQVNSLILKGISCQYKGLMFLIQDENDVAQLPKILRSYYIYLSEGITIDRPVWTEPYEDFNGFGQVITVSMPIYYQQGTIRNILGVVGIDVSVEYLKQLGLQNNTQVVKFIMSDMICYNNSLLECQLEFLRSDMAKCGVEECGTNQTVASCSQTVSEDIFVEGSSTDESICCGVSIAGLIWIIIGGVIFLHIAIGLTVSICCLHCKDIIIRRKSSVFPTQQNTSIPKTNWQ